MASENRNQEEAEDADPGKHGNGHASLGRLEQAAEQGERDNGQTSHSPRTLQLRPVLFARLFALPQSRSRQPDSLASIVAEVLDEFRVPLPNDVVRILASQRRGQAVSAEQLSRAAAYERTSFLKTRLPPLLCNVLNDSGQAVRPRIWAKGDWRLGRRLRTPDVLGHWQAHLALQLCATMSAAPAPTGQLGQVALEAVSRVLGPVAAFLPGSADEWSGFAQRIRLEHPDPDVTLLTSQQGNAEEILQDPGSGLSPVSLYFGLQPTETLEGAPASPGKLRLPQQGERGRPFDRIVIQRFAGNEQEAQHLLAYLQAWSLLYDRSGRPPTSAEYAEQWRDPLPMVGTHEARFAAAFPEEADHGPERIVRLLDQGLPTTGEVVPWVGVEVVDDAAVRDVPAPAPGQVWSGDEGTLTLSWAEGSAVIGQLSRQDGSVELWAADRSKLLSEFRLCPPEKVWLAAFDVSVLPTSLGPVLEAAGIAPVRYARPGDPRHGKNSLAVGTIEAHVVGDDPDDVRARVVRALKGSLALNPEDVFVRPLGTG